MVDYMRSHAIEGPWPAGERVLVCVQGGRKAIATVRHAKRLADQLARAVDRDQCRNRAVEPAPEQDSVVRRRCGWRSGWARSRC